MSIPELDNRGLLPHGIHPCTAREVEAYFVNRFPQSNSRRELMLSLNSYVALCKQYEHFDHIVLDGSFVTDKDDPRDIDLIVALRPTVLQDADSGEIVGRLTDRASVKRHYRIDAFPALTGSSEYNKWVSYFCVDRNQRVRGLLLIR